MRAAASFRIYPIMVCTFAIGFAVPFVITPGFVTYVPSTTINLQRACQ